MGFTSFEHSGSQASSARVCCRLSCLPHTETAAGIAIALPAGEGNAAKAEAEVVPAAESCPVTLGVTQGMMSLQCQQGCVPCSPAPHTSAPPASWAPST